jgi:hypothetical protein
VIMQKETGKTRASIGFKAQLAILSSFSQQG